MRNDLLVSQSVSIDASPEKVWNVLTTPVLISEYLYGTETLTDWKPGSAIIFQGEYGNQSYRDKGVILENTPYQLLRYSYWSGFSGVEDKPENYSTITYSLQKTGNNQTEFTWSQQGFATEDGYNHSLNGMTDLLNQIKAIAER